MAGGEKILPLTRPAAVWRQQNCHWSPSMIEIFQYASHQVSVDEFCLRKTEYSEPNAKLMNFGRGQGARRKKRERTWVREHF